MADMPPADIEVTEARVRAALQEQAPEFAHLSLELIGEGWDNVMFRLDDELALRVPRREIAIPNLRNEQRWLPQLAPLLPVPIPAPVVCGEPSEVLATPWAIVPWVEGIPVAGVERERRGALVPGLAAFLRA